MAKSAKKQNAQSDQKVAVFYHAKCIDGAAAAYAAHLKFGDAAKYYPIGHKSNEDTEKYIRERSNKNTHVIFADYAPTKQVLENIINHTDHVTIYDHHDTAIEELQNYKHKKLKTVFDKYQSGGAITFSELHGKKPVPLSIELAEMIDMGRFDDHSRDKETNYKIAAYMDSLQNDTIQDIVENFAEIDGLTPKVIANMGAPIRRLKVQETGELIDNALFARVQLADGVRPLFIPIINTQLKGTDREMESELRKLAGGILVGVAMCWHEDKNRVVHVSIRSIGVPSAKDVAQYLGSKGISGGGHETAAAAHFTKEQFDALFPRHTREEAANKITNEKITVTDPSAEKIHEPDRSRKQGYE